MRNMSDSVRTSAVLVTQYVCKHTLFAFLFKHLSFLSGTLLLPGLAAANVFPSAGTHHRLPRVASAQRTGLLEALSHLLMEESPKLLVTGRNYFLLEV